MNKKKNNKHKKKHGYSHLLYQRSIWMDHMIRMRVIWNKTNNKRKNKERKKLSRKEKNRLRRRKNRKWVKLIK